MIRITPEAIAGYCSTGKSRKGGRRQGFEWRAPRYLAEGEDTLGPLALDYSELYSSSPEAAYLIPDVELVNGQLAPSSRTLRSPMSQARFLELLRGLLLDAGYTEDMSHRVTFNTLRRFLPSLGEVLGLEDREAQCISNWAELAKGVRGRQAQATHSTSRTYAADKHQTACIVKHKVVIALHSASAAAARPPLLQLEPSPSRAAHGQRRYLARQTWPPGAHRHHGRPPSRRGRQVPPAPQWRMQERPRNMHRRQICPSWPSAGAPTSRMKFFQVARRCRIAGTLHSARSLWCPWEAAPTR